MWQSKKVLTRDAGVGWAGEGGGRVERLFEEEEEERGGREGYERECSGGRQGSASTSEVACDEKREADRIFDTFLQ